MAVADLSGEVRRTVRRHAMLAGGETVLVAVSGGADSVGLLHALLALAPALDLRLHVLHVDHRLRPDSRRDADFVLALARRLGVPAEVAAVSVEPRGSLEEAARAARYEALEREADRLGAQRIALGHTANDQAETVLMRLLQGAGLRGLAGIPSVRGRVIRPLIETRRRTIVAALERAGLEWVEDPSNADEKFLRNRIRHQLLPLLAAEYDADVVTALNRLARRCRDASDTVRRLALAELDRLAVVGGDDVEVPLEDLRRLPPAVAAEVLVVALRRLGRRAPLRAWAHRGLARLLATPAPRRAFRFAGVTAEVSVGRLRIARRPAPSIQPRALDVPGSVVLPEVGLVLEARVVTAGGYALPRDALRTAFDADRLPARLAVRGRRPGDRFAPFGGPERRLRAFLIAERVPRWNRGRLPLVEADGQIVWVAGLRRGAVAPLGPHTRRVLELRLSPLAA